MASAVPTTVLAEKPLIDWGEVSALIHCGLYNTLQDDLCTDFEIEVEGKSFRCHKVVLASVSDYFKALFRSGMKEVMDGKVKLEDVSSGALKVLIDILYPRDHQHDPFQTSSDEEMVELFNLASRFQMPFLKQTYTNYFSNTMSTQNCIDRWNISRNMGCDEVYDMSFGFLTSNFHLLLHYQMDVLLSLTYEDLLVILEDNELCVKDEKQIWNLVIGWIDVDRETRHVHFPDLLHECCLTEIERDFLIEDISFHSLVRKNDAASRRVLEAVKYETHPDLHGNLEINLRPCCDKGQSLFLLVAGESGHKAKVVSRSIRRQEWFSSWPFLEAGRDIACCVRGDTLCVSHRDKFFGFEGTSCTWKAVDVRGIETLTGHTMTNVGDSLFILGGKTRSFTNTRVYRMDKGNKKWEWDGDVIAPVVNASSVAINGNIYLFGGNSNNEPADCVQVYDTTTQSGTIFTSLPKPCRWSRAVCRGKVAYVVTSDGDVVEMSVQDVSCRLIATIPAFHHTNFGMDVNGGQLCVYGGKDIKPYLTQLAEEVDDDSNDDDDAGELFAKTDRNISNRVVTVNIESGIVKDIEPLPERWEVLGCARLVHELGNGTEQTAVLK